MKSAINPTNFRRKARPASKETKTAATFTIGPKHKRHFSLQACDHIGIFTMESHKDNYGTQKRNCASRIQSKNPAHEIP
jgi:hypothetical protein